MSQFQNSVVLIAPAALRAAANALAEAMGWGPDNYSVPLSPGGAEPATHYGLHTWATDDFLATVAGAEAGELPPHLGGAGMAPAQVAGLIAQLIISVQGSAEQHFESVLAERGLQRVVSEGEL